MTVLSPSQIVGMALPSLAPSSFSSNGPAPAGLGGKIHDTWANRDGIKAKTQAERRGSIKAARAKVESAGYTTKQQRVAADAGKSSRYAGSPREREKTKGSVANAIAALDDVVLDTDISATDFRRVREVLRQRYPGASLSSMLTEAARLEQMLLDDPVQAREILVAAYSRAKTPGFVEPKHETGLRASLRRAAQDQADAEDLKGWIVKYGKRLPQIMAELEATDRALHQNTAYESARIAARHGAPAVESEIAPYEAKMAHKHHYNSVVQGVQMAIEHGIIDGDEKHLNNMADVLAHPQFPWAEHRARHGQHANLVALRHAHEVALQLPGKRNAKKPSDAGSKSISGGPSARHLDREAGRDRGTGGIRDSIARVRAAL